VFTGWILEEEYEQVFVVGSNNESCGGAEIVAKPQLSISDIYFDRFVMGRFAKRGEKRSYLRLILMA
jgi:hypothetical protein